MIFVHPGKWSDPRRNAVATGILALSSQKPSTSAKCDTTLGIASLKNYPTGVRSLKTIRVSPLVSEWPEHASV